MNPAGDPMKAPLTHKWRLASVLLLPPLLAILGIALFGWNWARGPLQRLTFEKTGRELLIAGDLTVSLGWPTAHLVAQTVNFANPTWATEKQMVAVDEVELGVDLPELFRMNLVFPEVRLTRPTVFLEKAVDGRKTWLLDRDQSDETARISIGRLTLDSGKLGYDDAGQKTSIRAELTTPDKQADQPEDTGVIFSAKGLYQGLVLAAHGSGGSVLALQDESLPYPLSVDATIGHTGIKAAGTVTSLSRISAADMRLALRGDSLALLYPLIGIAVPETHPYAISGHLLHSGQLWRYEKLSGLMGNSDLAGSLQLDNGGIRPFMRGELVSKKLDFGDLGPLIGAKESLKASSAGGRLLPDTAFKTERWNSVDADISLHASTILRAKELPLEDLRAHLKLQNSLLTLNPLDFGVAGGHLKAVVSLDGRHDPIQAHARISARQILLARLFPGVNLAKTSIGQVNGEIDLAGQGNSVGRMLATSNGKIGLIVANGEVSKLLMEKVSLHLLEILQLSMMGDKTVKLRCAVADFGVKGGVMKANALIFDTEVSTITGDGSIDLDREKLDLTFVPKTRNTSPVALRTPIHVGGTFARPEIDLDKGRIAARGVGALALGLLNPLLVLIPLVEMGPGIESECGRLIHAAQAQH
ncbi:MAG: AsmA family protein [Proteobacteria bacterium]|nr:AsmA family protein [Pseudomonadota bacterium]